MSGDSDTITDRFPHMGDDALVYGVPAWAMYAYKALVMLVGLGLSIAALTGLNGPAQLGLGGVALAVLLFAALIQAGNGLVYFVANRDGLWFPVMEGLSRIPGQRPVHWLRVPWDSVIGVDVARVRHPEGGGNRGIAYRFSASDEAVARTFARGHVPLQLTEGADGRRSLWQIEFVSLFHPPTDVQQTVERLMQAHYHETATNTA